MAHSSRKSLGCLHPKQSRGTKASRSTQPLEGEPPRSLMDSARSGNGRFDRGDNGNRRALRAHVRVAQEHLAPLGRLAPALEDTAINEGPAVEVVIDVAGEDEAVDERRVEEQ